MKFNPDPPSSLDTSVLKLLALTTFDGVFLFGTVELSSPGRLLLSINGEFLPALSAIYT